MKTIDASVQMMARNSADYIEPCLMSILPHVSRVIVALDSRSSDGTENILTKLSARFDNLEWYKFIVKDPLVDLVAMRNSLLARGQGEKFGWIVDSDEYYPDTSFPPLESILRRYWGIISFGLTSWAVWDKARAHMITSNRPTMRIFRNSYHLHWDGTFGNEKLLLGDIDLCHEFLTLTIKYVHFTHVKSDAWRAEMRRMRRIDVNNVALIELPPEIKSVVAKINGR